MKAIVIENIEGPLSMQYLFPRDGISEVELESSINLSKYIRELILSCLNLDGGDSNYRTPTSRRDQLVEHLRYTRVFYRSIRYMRNKNFDNLNKIYLEDLKKETEIVLKELELIHKTMSSWITIPVDIY
jgi:hypothetical protein